MTTNPEAGMRPATSQASWANDPRMTAAEASPLNAIRYAVESWEEYGDPADAMTFLEMWEQGDLSESQQYREWCLAAAPVAPAGTEGETGWLIESWNSKTGEFGATWWSLDDSLEDAQGWTKDSTIALRFARKADAQAYIDNTAWTEAKPTEHRWHDALAARAQPSAGGEGLTGDKLASAVHASVLRKWAVEMERSAASMRPFDRTVAEGNDKIAFDLNQAAKHLEALAARAQPQGGEVECERCVGTGWIQSFKAVHTDGGSVSCPDCCNGFIAHPAEPAARDGGEAQ